MEKLYHGTTWEKGNDIIDQRAFSTDAPVWLVSRMQTHLALGFARRRAGPNRKIAAVVIYATQEAIRRMRNEGSLIMSQFDHQDHVSLRGQNQYEVAKWAVPFLNEHVERWELYGLDPKDEFKFEALPRREVWLEGGEEHELRDGEPLD